MESESEKRLSQISRVGDRAITRFAGEEVRAYIPKPLPPIPPLNLSPLVPLMEQANQALGRLDGLSRILPNVWLFVYFYVRKEAVFSSQIEGTQSSLSDLLMHESHQNSGLGLDDVQELSNYVSALTHGIKRLRGDFPLSLRLIKEIHEILLANGRGSSKLPGEFRTSQNWIHGSRPGNATFVPPPPEQLMTCLSDLEHFLHVPPSEYSPLIKAALVHVQFETIHPFLDGNGRLGRLLISLLLCADGVLAEPILYLSLYFKTHRQAYYEHLQNVRETGDWESWIAFFLEGVLVTAKQGTDTAKEILRVLEEDTQLIHQVKRSSQTMLRIHQFMQKNPIVSMPQLSQSLNLVATTIASALDRLQTLGIVREMTGKQRGRIFVYDRYLNLLQEGTDSPFQAAL